MQIERKSEKRSAINQNQKNAFNPFAKDAAKHVRARLREGRENGDFEDLSYLREAILESEPDMQEVIVSNLFDNMRLQWKNLSHC